jgi:hypothetical protein
MIKTRPAEGWVKARHLKTAEDAEKMARLLEEVRILEKELEALRRTGVADTSGLAQGNDPVRLEFTGGVKIDATWNEVFEVVGRLCLDLPTNQLVREALYHRWSPEGGGYATERCVETIKLQLYSLGLIKITSIVQQVSQAGSFVTPAPSGPTSYVSLRWELTEFGRTKLGELAGVKRPV